MYNDRYTAKDIIKYANEGFMAMLDEVDQMLTDKKKSKDNDERTLSAYTQKIVKKHLDKRLGIPIG